MVLLKILNKARSNDYYYYYYYDIVIIIKLRRKIISVRFIIILFVSVEIVNV